MNSAEYMEGYIEEDVAPAKGPMDLPFLLLTLLLLGVGLVMVFSASFVSSNYDYGNPTVFFSKQAILGAAGVLIMFVVSFMDYRLFKVLSVPILIVSIICLILVYVPGIGVSHGGARRWINLGVTEFQPSEIAKLAVIMTFSLMICTYKEKMKTFKYGILPFVLILAVLAALIINQRHLSGTILVVTTGGALMFVGGVKLRWIFGVICAGGAVASIFIFFTDYAQARIISWRNPELDPTGDGWQIMQSLYAIGSGGLFGVGLGKSRQKYLYLPEEHNDFIFAVVCEELGFIGALMVLLLFALLIIRGYWLAIHARDKYGSLLITGIITLFAVQTFLNIAVVTNFIPVTGISLPFFSYGGTALMMQLLEMGIVLSVSRRIPAPKSG